jgi:hypothetical protein
LRGTAACFDELGSGHGPRGSDGAFLHRSV